MMQLQNDWLTSGLIDFEYKKYLVLAYLQATSKKFDDYKLYPFLSDLAFHYQNLNHLKENKKLMHQNFPKVITKADFKKLKLTYQKIIEDDEVMTVIEDILAFSLPQFKEALENGKGLFEFVESKLEISPVGISPIYFKEGYMFINRKNDKTLRIYRYKVTILENQDETFHGIHTEYLEEQRSSIANTFEAIKLDLIRRYHNLPNPATYLVISHTSLPFNHTLLPVAKRLLLRHINSTAA